MARLHDIVFDARHPASLARFWAAALEGHAVAPYDAAEIERLRSEGIEDTEDDPTVLVETPGLGPRLFFQRVPEPKVVKNRLHLDLRCDNLQAELKRLVELGARVLSIRSRAGASWVTLSDPEGNEFCLST